MGLAGRRVRATPGVDRLPPRKKGDDRRARRCGRTNFGSEAAGTAHVCQKHAEEEAHHDLAARHAATQSVPAVHAKRCVAPAQASRQGDE